MAKENYAVRLETEEINDIKQLASEKGITQGEVHSLMLKALKEKDLKATVPGRADDIDAFNAGLSSLKDLFYASISFASLAKKDAEQEGKEKLEMANRTIKDLQIQTDAFKEQVEHLKHDIHVLTDDKVSLQSEVARLVKVVEEKDVMIKSLQANAKLMEKLESLVADK